MITMGNLWRMIMICDQHPCALEEFHVCSSLNMVCDADSACTVKGYCRLLLPSVLSLQLYMF